MNIFNYFKDILKLKIKEFSEDGSKLDVALYDRINVEAPRDPTHGDLATNAALLLAKPLGLPPRVVAEKLAAALERLEFRKWTDVGGLHTIVAAYESFDGTVVALRGRTGKEIRLPIDRLSTPDQEFILSQAGPVDADAATLLYPIVKDGKHGYINRSGQFGEYYAYLEDFHDGLARMVVTDDSGVPWQSAYIDTSGAYIWASHAGSFALKELPQEAL